MMRLILLSCVFVGATGGLIMALMPPAQEPVSDAVSRGQAAPLSLQPAIPSAALITPEPAAVRAPAAVVQPMPQPVPQPAVAQAVPQRLPSDQRPQARPADLVPVAKAIVPPAPVQTAPLATARTETSVVTPLNVPMANSTEEVDETLNAIGHSIVQQLMKPSSGPAPSLQRQAVVIPPKATPAPAPAPVQPAAPEAVAYIVKDGDSLPGLAFRFFGTTAAYLTIVDANPELRENPQAFRSGMTLMIPKSP